MPHRGWLGPDAASTTAQMALAPVVVLHRLLRGKMKQRQQDRDNNKTIH